MLLLCLRQCCRQVKCVHWDMDIVRDTPLMNATGRTLEAERGAEYSRLPGACNITVRSLLSDYDLQKKIDSMISCPSQMNGGCPLFAQPKHAPSLVKRKSIEKPLKWILRVDTTTAVLSVTYTDAFEVRELRLRQYGIHVVPFHEETFIQVIVTAVLKNAEGNIFYVHRND